MINQVLGITREAGSSILPVYAAMRAADTSSVGVSSKVDGSPVTKADLIAHQVIARGLASLAPEIPVVSEEDVQSFARAVRTGRFWLVDPLDGTKEFLSRSDEFTVNIALIENGAPILGVVLAPALGEMYWGTVNGGAFRGDDRQVTRIGVALPNEAPLRVVASKSHMNAETVQFIGRLAKHQLVQAGSSLKFCRVAEGRADIYPRLGPTCEWDTAAGHAVLVAAGGCVCTMDGAPLWYGKSAVQNPHFVASSAPLSVYLEAT